MLGNNKAAVRQTECYKEYEKIKLIPFFNEHWTHN